MEDAATPAPATPAENSLTLAQVRALLGITDARVLATARGLPAVMSPYLSPDSTRMTSAEVDQLRALLLAEVETCLHDRPELAVRLLGLKPFIEAYHEHAGKERTAPAHPARSGAQARRSQFGVR